MPQSESGFHRTVAQDPDLERVDESFACSLWNVFALSVPKIGWA